MEVVRRVNGSWNAEGKRLERGGKVVGMRRERGGKEVAGENDYQITNSFSY